MIAICLVAVTVLHGVRRVEQEPAAAARQGNGEFLVEVFSGGEWCEAGSAAFDRFLRSRSIELDRFGAVERVRLTRRGGGMAHIDFIAPRSAIETRNTRLPSGVRAITFA